MPATSAVPSPPPISTTPLRMAVVVTNGSALQVVAVFMSQSALFKTLNLFPPEKNLVAAERAKGSYDVLPYFLSKLLAELPMIAAYPLLFSAVLYPMAGLQPSVRAGRSCRHRRVRCCRYVRSSASSAACPTTCVANFQARAGTGAEAAFVVCGLALW